MRKVAIAAVALLTAGTFINTYANIGVVDMKKVFDNSAKVKNLKDKLEKRFASDKDNLEKMGKTLQDDLQNYQKNKSVMNEKDLDTLQTKISSEEMTFRNEQTRFQQEVYNAQNEAMENFMTQVKGVVKTVAEQKNIDLVLPDNDVLYSKSDMDLTSDVLKKLG